jgi:DNA topoisomerase-1
MDTITLDEALYLFQLPRKLGETDAGEPISVAIGQFGPYVKYGSKYVSLKDDDPYTVTRERAIEVIAAKQLADANRLIHDFGVDDIQVLNGRYGPYITDKQRNARIPKDRDPKTLTLDECRALLAAAPVRGRFGKKAKTPAKTAKAKSAAATDAKPAKAPKAKAPAKKAKKKAKRKSAAKAKSAKPKTAAAAGKPSQAGAAG